MRNVLNSLGLFVCVAWLFTAPPDSIAQIVFRDIPDVTVSSALQSIPIDVTNNGTPEFLLQYEAGTVDGANVRAVGVKPVNNGEAVTGRVQDVFGTPLPFADALALNTPISSATVDSAAFCVRVALGFIVTHNGDSQWRQGFNYFGFSFLMSDGVNPPTRHYGWGRAAANSACSQATLTEFAYQSTAEEPILAGDMGALPVELVSFDAFADGLNVSLTWQTASETDNAGFEVQQKIDGEFQQIGFVEGFGTTHLPQHYRFDLEDLLPGRHAFRLRQIDFDGRFAHSATVEIEIDVPGTHLLTAAYPNPFNPQTRFSLSVNHSQHVVVAVFDMLGRRVAVLHDGILDASGTQTFTLDGTGLNSGLYVVRAQGENFAETINVTLLK